MSILCPLESADNIFPNRVNKCMSILVISQLFSVLRKNRRTVFPSFVFRFPKNNYAIHIKEFNILNKYFYLGPQYRPAIPFPYEIGLEYVFLFRKVVIYVLLILPINIKFIVYNM